jgi:mannitol/fructose-specific phosphotransferase system IIA component
MAHDLTPEELKARLNRTPIRLGEFLLVPHPTDPYRSIAYKNGEEFIWGDNLRAVEKK